MFCWCPTAIASAIIALFNPWLSLFGLCCLLQRPSIQHLHNWYRKKDTTTAVTKITKTPVEPPKLNATTDSLSVSEVDVRIVSWAWGAACELPMLVMLGMAQGMAWLPIYTGVNPHFWPLLSIMICYQHDVSISIITENLFFKRSGHTVILPSQIYKISWISQLWRTYRLRCYCIYLKCCLIETWR